MLTLSKRALLFMSVSLTLHNAMAAGASEVAPKTSQPTKAPQPDVKFLEYLGTVEDDEDNWMDVELGASESKANAPVGKAAKEPVRSVEKK